jgi:membrane protein YqaA with SNARE-associated domain
MVLVNQLAIGGRMVIPVGDRHTQDLIKLYRDEQGIHQSNLGGCRFVKLIGEHGWRELKCSDASTTGCSTGRRPLRHLGFFLLAFAESSFFPIPPDVLLIAMCVALPEKSFKYALVCSVGSIFGGCLGYLIGWQFMASVGIRIVDFYGLTDKVAYIETLYNTYDAWAVGIAGFTPIPYKVFTIAAGMFKINFTVFVWHPWRPDRPVFSW